MPIAALSTAKTGGGGWAEGTERIWEVHRFKKVKTWKLMTKCTENMVKRSRNITAGILNRSTLHSNPLLKTSLAQYLLVLPMLCACFEGFVNILFPCWNNFGSVSLSYEI